MSPAVCFRCDWEGSTRGRTCPSCAAPLYREPRARPESLDDELVPVGDERSRRPVGRGVSIGIAMALAALLIVAIELFPERARTASSGTLREEPATDQPVSSGSLVYLTRSNGARPALWVLDLQGGGGGPGPAVPPHTSELVDLSGAAPDWIGIERPAERRRVFAAVVRGVDAAADITGLGRGDLVAWGPGGRSLVFARNGHTGPGGCAPLRISLVTVVTNHEEWALDDPGFCGPALSLSRSTAATYFTAASGDRLSVYLTGSVGVPHLMFDELGVLSAAPPAAFLLSPDAVEATLDDEPSHAGTFLGWKGIGGPVTVGDGRNLLVVKRILSWSADGGRVALVGALGEREGVFVLSAGSGSGPRVPRFVTPASRTTDATFDAGGRLYLAVDGRILVARGHAVTTLPLPGDTPPPSGPIVWIP